MSLHVVEAEADIVPELDAGEFADARLLADPRFGDAKMFRELLRVQKSGKTVAFDVAVAFGE